MHRKGKSDSDWPFSDPKNVATITLRQILEDGRPILYVSHDAEDGCWQFMDGGDAPDVKDGREVSLQCMVEWDPSVRELADLPLGWCAWREHAGAPWQRAPREGEAD